MAKPTSTGVIHHTNQFGARVITCDQHYADAIKHVFGTITRVGPVDQECPTCRDERMKAEHPGKVRAALLSQNFSHTRAIYSSVYIYHRDDTSPTGVLCEVGCDPVLFDTIYNELRAAGLIGSGASPLSPTEPR